MLAAWTRRRASGARSCARSATPRSTCRASGPTAWPTSWSTSTTTSSMGGTAYGELARGGTGWTGDPFGDVFAELAANFVRFVEVLCVVSRRTAHVAEQRGRRAAVPALAAHQEPVAAARLARAGRDRRAAATAGCSERAGASAPRPALDPDAPAAAGSRRSTASRRDLDVDAFVIDERAARIEPASRARRASSCWCARTDGELVAGAVRRRAALANLERHDPARGLDDGELQRLLPRARGREPLRLPRAVRGAATARVSALELELQAEVDKFVCCVLLQPA